MAALAGRALALLALAVLATGVPAALPRPSVSAAAAAQPPPPPSPSNLHAVIVAGSAGWGNYRHQADALHAYAVLTARGVPASRIVLMVADDLRGHPSNPAPGTVINSPGGRDLRQGVTVDYSGTDVTATALLAVLAGNASAAAASTSPASTRRVLADLRPSDAVLLFYSDHGAEGVLGMPSGPPLYGDQLVPALQALPVADVVAVVEACEAGSLFEGLADAHDGGGPRVWALTAAAAGEPSWATFCPPKGGEQDRWGTCLGDAFAVAWLADAERMGGAGDDGGGDGWVVSHARRSHAGRHTDHHARPETLHAQFSAVRAAVHGSHVSQFGAVGWARTEPAAAVEGGRAAAVPLPLEPAGGAPAFRSLPQWEASGGSESVAPGLGAAALAGLASPPAPGGGRTPFPCVRRLADAWHRAGCGGGLSGTLSSPGLVRDQSGLRHAALLARACRAGADEGEVERRLVNACGGGGGGPQKEVGAPGARVHALASVLVHADTITA